METYLSSQGMANGLQQAASRLAAEARSAMRAPMETIPMDYSSMWYSCCQMMQCITAATHYMTTTKLVPELAPSETPTEPKPKPNSGRHDMLLKAAESQFRMAIADRKQNTFEAFLEALTEVVCLHCELILGDATEESFHLADSEKNLISNIFFQEDRGRRRRYSLTVENRTGGFVFAVEDAYKHHMVDCIASIYEVVDQAKFTYGDAERHNAMAIGLGHVLHRRGQACIQEGAK